MALEETQSHCDRCGRPTLHQCTTSGPPHLGCLLILLGCIVLSFLLPIIPWFITVPAILVTLVAWFLSILILGLSQQPYRCTQCGQITGKLTTRHKFNNLLWKMAGGEENVILYRFLQAFVVAIPVVILLTVIGIKASQDRARQERIETANREVRQAVEEAEKWIRNGQLCDANKVEQAVKAAKANPEATETASVAPTLAAFETTKGQRQAADVKANGERQATEILESALEAITRHQFDKAQTFLRQYLDHQYAKEHHKAETLLAEIPLATSDDDALRTLLAMDDTSFASFSKGDVSAVVLSHPALVETRVATLKKNLAEAGRQREEKRKQAEVQRIAEQKRIEAEKKAAALARAR